VVEEEINANKRCETCTHCIINDFGAGHLCCKLVVRYSAVKLDSVCDDWRGDDD
jgi:hypothetical protein